MSIKLSTGGCCHPIDSLSHFALIFPTLDNDDDGTKRMCGVFDDTRDLCL